MPIINSDGNTIITGKGINLFSLVSTKHRIIMEGKAKKFGMRSNNFATIDAMRQFGVPGKASDKNRAIVLAKIEEAILSVSTSVAEENRIEAMK